MPFEDKEAVSKEVIPFLSQIDMILEMWDVAHAPDTSKHYIIAKKTDSITAEKRISQNQF